MTAADSPGSWAGRMVDRLRDQAQRGWARWPAYATGGALICVGLNGLLRHADQTAPVDWAIWLAGGAIAHDLLVVPLVVLTGLLAARIPAPWRGPLQSGIVVAACVTVVALPLVLGLGRRADNPSQLPLSYGRNLLALLIAIVLASAVTAAITAYRRDMGRTVLTILGVVLAVWVAFAVVGMIISMVKTLIFWGVIAAVLMAVVMLISKTSSKKT